MEGKVVMGMHEILDLETQYLVTTDKVKIYATHSSPIKLYSQSKKCGK